MDVMVTACQDYRQESVSRAMEQLSALFQSQVRPGDTVLIKPNWLAASHRHRPDEWLGVITHPSVITAALEQVLVCLQGEGRVIITDAPQTDSSWKGIMARMTPDQWISMGERAGVSVEVMDLRDHEWTAKDGVVIDRRELPGDPLGSTACDLQERSEFVGHRPSALGYYGADYDKAETLEAHSGGHHRYKVSRTVIEADVFINLPKMKTHKKAGITCSLKNLVGINTYKNWLPHHNEGTPVQGGDQFPDAAPKRRLEAAVLGRLKTAMASYPPLSKAFVPMKAVGKRLFGDTQETVRNGNWYGNDTLWRTVLDLNKVLLYAEPDGSLRPDELSSRKRYLSIVDGITAGEGNGPEAPDAIEAGLLIGGDDPVAVDMACARAMGLDWERIPCLTRAFRIQHHPLTEQSPAELSLRDLSQDWSGPLGEWLPRPALQFRPHFGWTGHLELSLAS